MLVGQRTNIKSELDGTEGNLQLALIYRKGTVCSSCLFFSLGRDPRCWHSGQLRIALALAARIFGG